MSNAAAAIPATFSFRFVAIDGWTYPVTVEFLARLPATHVVGVSRTFEMAFRSRAIPLHEVTPRCRVVITVDNSDAIRPSGTYTDGDHARLNALHNSGANLADQIYIALQMRA